MSVGWRIKKIAKAKGLRGCDIDKKLSRYNGWFCRSTTGRRRLSATDVQDLSECLSSPIVSFFTPDTTAKSVVSKLGEEEEKDDEV